MKLRITIIIIMITVYSVISLPGVYSSEIDGIYFKDEYSQSGIKHTLRGYAILNYMVFIKAYAGALYLPQETASDKALSETARIIELYYYHKISAEDFRESTIEMIRKNTTSAEYDRIKNQAGIFNGFYKDVNPGDRYRAEFIPGKGTTLYLNGGTLGTLKGDEFSKAFFSIWIGKNPIDRKFRDRLLGNK